MVRNITVYEREAQKKTVFENVDVNTLADVKTLLDNKGINYSNMDFLEGVSKVRLMVDDTVLPSNIPYKGNTTNDLVILMTMKNQKISSGVYTRTDCYTYIKENGLSEEVKEVFGKHYTNVPTEDLIKFISEGEPVESPVNQDKDDYEKALDIVESLYNMGDLDHEEYSILSRVLARKSPDENKGFKRDEIEDMIDSLGI